jgi:hypothetical protein
MDSTYAHKRMDIDLSYPRTFGACDARLRARALAVSARANARTAVPSHPHPARLTWELHLLRGAGACGEAYGADREQPTRAQIEAELVKAGAPLDSLAFVKEYGCTHTHTHTHAQTHTQYTHARTRACARGEDAYKSVRTFESGRGCRGPDHAWARPHCGADQVQTAPSLHSGSPPARPTPCRRNRPAIPLGSPRVLACALAPFRARTNRERSLSRACGVARARREYFADDRLALAGSSGATAAPSSLTRLGSKFGLSSVTEYAHFPYPYAHYPYPYAHHPYPYARTRAAAATGVYDVCRACSARGYDGGWPGAVCSAGSSALRQSLRRAGSLAATNCEYPRSTLQYR